jgi:predicted TIM-barrel enzyme
MPINYVSAQAANVTTITSVYNPTTSTVQATMTGCLLANTTGSAVTASVTLTNAAATVTTNIVKNAIIPVGTSINILVDGTRIVVPQNYTVKVVSSGATDVTISAVEVS